MISKKEKNIFEKLKFFRFRKTRQTILFPKKKPFWPEYKVKIASTLFAIVIWFLIVTGDTFDYVVDVPIECATTRDDFIVTTPLPKKAKIHLRGQGMALIGFLIFREGKLQLEFEWREGVQTVKLSEKSVVLAGGAKNLAVEELIEPTEIKLKIEKLIVKKVPIKNQVHLKPAPGYTIVGKILLEPDMAEVQGPKSSVDSCDTVYTREISLEKLKRPVREQVELLAPTYHLVKLLQNYATLTADIQKLMEKRIQHIPVTVINLPPRTKAIVIPSYLSLTVDGGVNVVAGITEKDIVAYIDYRKYKKSNLHDFPAYIKPLPGVRFRDIDPQRFKIVLERE